jgi:peptidoglycan/LPS O-acetylase OafA/YrhL
VNKWMNSLQLPPLGNGHVGVFDGWRGIAVSLVLISHFCNVKAFYIGSMGVNLFFALSGLLMARILFVKRTPLSIFYQRRLSRVFPVFLIFVLLIYGWGAFRGSQEAENFWATLTFLRSYFGDIHIWKTDLPIGHLWSLNVEEHAYILLSLLTLFIRNIKVAGAALMSIGLLSIGIDLYYIINVESLSELYPSLSRQTEANLAYIMLSGGYAINKPRLHQSLAWLPLATIAAGIYCYSDSAHWAAKDAVAPFLFAFSIVHLTDSYKWFQHCLCWTPLRLIGLWSFSLYIWQQPLYAYVGAQGYPTHLVIAGLLMTFTTAWFSFYVVENPIRLKINTYFSKKNKNTQN